MTPADIDRLAEWCKLGEQGWRRDPESGVLCEPEWVRDVPGGVKVWHPLDSDDDCRVVLERFYAVASPHQKIDFYQPFVDDDIDGLGAFAERLLLASPREKCEAVAKVMGWD